MIDCFWGVKGTISEMDVATFRERTQTALTPMAARDLVRRVAIGVAVGYAKDPMIASRRIPTCRSAIDLIFRKFAELGSARRVYRVTQ